MTAHSFTVEVADRRTVTINADDFRRCNRLAVQLATHWQSSFSGVRSSSVSVYATTLRSFLRYTERLDGPPEDVRFLDAEVLDGWVRSLRETSSAGFARQRATSMRVLLDNLDPELLHDSLTEGTGVLRWRPEVERGTASLPDLTPGQWEALRKVAKRQVFTVTCRVMAAQREAAAGRDPGDDPGAWSQRENVYWLALRGRLSSVSLAEGLRGGRRCAPWPGWTAEVIRPGAAGMWAAKQVVVAVYRRVHPHRLDAAAFWVAMMIATGLPPESVTELEPDWFDTPPGGGITVLRYRKQRRAAPTVPLVLLATPRFSAQRLRDTYLTLSAPLRDVAGDSSAAAKLWCHATTSRGGSLSVGELDGYGRHFPRWLKAIGLTDPGRVRELEAARQGRLNGPRRPRGLVPPAGPARLRPLEAWSGPGDPRRIRKTDKAQRLVLYGAGVAANDHTVRVLIAHYTNSDLVRIRSAFIVTGVAEALTHFAAGPRRPTVIPGCIAEEASRDDDALTSLASLVGVDPAQLRAVLAGGQTIGGVACRNPYESPHDVPGRFCRQAGGELCLSCPQAVVLAEHVPVLWAELERLDRVAATISPGEFAVLHGERHRLIVDFLSVLDPDHIDRYRQRGIVPGPHPGWETPARLRRRRAR